VVSYCLSPHNTVSHDNVLYCTVLYLTVLYGTVLFLGAGCAGRQVRRPPGAGLLHGGGIEEVVAKAEKLAKELSSSG